jgi:uncharacterized membrane protein YphA (DoxX/SURF4 family)
MKKVIELSLRMYPAVMLFTYGLGKIMGGQFYRKGNMPEEIATISLSDATGFDLAWTFFGYSEVYILFIGISQILGSLLLLVNKTKLLGAFILVPIVLNIAIVDFTFNISNGALMSVLFYTLAIFGVLYINRKKIRKVFYELVSIKGSLPLKKKVFNFCIAIVIVGLFIFIENSLLNIVGR